MNFVTQNTKAKLVKDYTRLQIREENEKKKKMICKVLQQNIRTHLRIQTIQYTSFFFFFFEPRRGSQFQIRNLRNLQTE